MFSIPSYTLPGQQDLSSTMSLLIAVVLFIATGHGLIMPLTKPNGSVDLTSLVNHITLLEQVMESKDSDLKSQLQATQQELKEVKSDLQETKTEVAVLKSQLKSSQHTATQPSIDIVSLRSDVSHLETDLLVLKSQLFGTSGNVTNAGGAIFTRWGRTTCPAGNNVIYKGYTAGSNYADKASSASILCLPDHPIYANHTPGRHGATIWGAEYEMYESGTIFHNILNEDIPCVVCESKTKRSTIMVPARNQCYPGWNLEYWGYLMGEYDKYASAEYVCVDKDPESILGGQENKDGLLLHMVESVCGSLQCPPYVDNWELTCAVCSQ